MRVLVTCFEPFGSDTANASQEAVGALPQEIAGAEVVKATLPVVFGQSIDTLRETIEQYMPDIVICIGQATGRCAITPERVAINVIDARMEDNSGMQPTDQQIVAGGPAAYFSSLPIKAMVAAMQEAGIPAAVSNTAGTYVCNQLMYGLMHLIHTEHPNIMGGFIHVPCTTAQAATKKNVSVKPDEQRSSSLEQCRGEETCVLKSVPSMAVGDIIRGLSIAIGVTIGHK